ncbi:hypothetical protein ACFCYI_04005 [Streptomyces sp. NPDC056257]|uniref:hypothetical protein n=1 Tax=Streptomyces sp. NPDC056257 TaxID=3345765 RepID=UPI0035DB2112
MVVDVWHWIERNAAGLSLLVPFLAIGGGLLGNWLGAKVQAAGGLAQASAAREAARITAEASRLAALRDERRLAIAEFVRAVRVLFRLTGELYLRGAEEEARSAYADLAQAYAALELSAPWSLVELAVEVQEAVAASYFAARTRGLTARAMALVTGGASDRGGSGGSVYAAVVAVHDAQRRRSADVVRLTVEAERVLRAWGVLDEAQIRAVLFSPPAGMADRQEEADVLKAALIAFVRAARESLGANREGGVEWIPEPGGTRPTQI